MTNTTYYNLNIVEGTDIVNPLTVDNPNYEKIDEAMHDNAVAGVTLAAEIANGTVHAITRENSDCAVIRFIATSVWKAGDTATVDGVPVTALLPSGETLPDGAYVINANVLCILTGTNLTVYAERKKTDNASEIAYNGTNVSMELNKINNSLNVKSGSITTDYSDVPISYSYNSFMSMIYINGLKNVPKDVTTIICTLPEGARPSGDRIIDMTNSSGAFVRLTIQSSGNVIVYNYTNVNPGNISQSFTYMK